MVRRTAGRPAWHSLLVAGVLVGTVGFLVCAAFVGLIDLRAKERRWLADRHHGTATMAYLLPGDVNTDHGTQDLQCRLEVMAHGMPTISGDYKAAVGLLDALKVVEGARFRARPARRSPSKSSSASPRAGSWSSNAAEHRRPLRPEGLRHKACKGQEPQGKPGAVVTQHPPSTEHDPAGGPATVSATKPCDDLPPRALSLAS